MLYLHLSFVMVIVLIILQQTLFSLIHYLHKDVIANLCLEYVKDFNSTFSELRTDNN